MKELYVSDLDGTLLDNDARLTEQTASIINGLIADGLNFTIATARSLETALDAVTGLDLCLPIAAMNGVLIYDTSEKKLLNAEYLGKDASKQIASVLRSHGAAGFMHKLCGAQTTTYYETLDNPAVRAFYEKRTKSNSSRKFAKSAGFYEEADESVILFIVKDTKQALLKIAEDIDKIPGITYVMYKDIYTEDIYYFEIFSDKASKANASLFIKRSLGLDKLITFGDNHNDMGMFEVSDECYAVSNAHPDLKRLAKAEIGSNDEDAVALFLEKRFK